MAKIVITPDLKDFLLLCDCGLRDDIGIKTLFVKPSGEAFKLDRSSANLLSNNMGWENRVKPLSPDEIWFGDEKKQTAWERKIEKHRIKIEAINYDRYITALRKTEVIGLDKVLLYFALKELPRVKDKILRSNFYEEKYAETLYKLIRETNLTISKRKIYHCIGLIFYISGIGYEFNGDCVKVIYPFSQEKIRWVLNPFSPEYEKNEVKKGITIPKSSDSYKLINRIARIFTNTRKIYHF